MIRWPIICIVYVCAYSSPKDATRIPRNISPIRFIPARSPAAMYRSMATLSR